jgi:hypothetical protein
MPPHFWQEMCGKAVDGSTTNTELSLLGVGLKTRNVRIDNLFSDRSRVSYVIIKMRFNLQSLVICDALMMARRGRNM